MIEKFNAWLKEAVTEPKKPAQHKAGDRVLLRDSDEKVKAEFYNGWKKTWTSGLYCEILDVRNESGKWVYDGKILAGTLHGYPGRSHAESVYSSSRKNVVRFPQSEIKDDPATLSKVENLLKIAKHEPGQTVSYVKDGNNRTGVIRGISIRDLSQVEYYVGKDGSIPERDIEADISISTAQEDLIAEEIAKMAGVKVKEMRTSSIEFEVLGYVLQENVQGVFYARNKEDVEKLAREIEKLISEHQNPVLQRTMNEGHPSAIKVTTRTSWKGGSIDRKNIKDAAKNLKMDLKELFHKFRGKIAGGDYGV